MDLFASRATIQNHHPASYLFLLIPLVAGFNVS